VVEVAANAFGKHLMVCFGSVDYTGILNERSLWFVFRIVVVGIGRNDSVCKKGSDEGAGIRAVAIVMTGT
jgi:hypothetical protein